MRKRRSFSKDFKLEAMRRLELERGNKSAAEVAQELGIRRNLLYKWQVQRRAKGEIDVFPGRGRSAAAEAEVARLKRALARLEEENTRLKKAVVYFESESLLGESAELAPSL
jgi:transposase-like protein